MVKIISNLQQINSLPFVMGNKKSKNNKSADKPFTIPPKYVALDSIAMVVIGVLAIVVSDIMMALISVIKSDTVTVMETQSNHNNDIDLEKSLRQKIQEKLNKNPSLKSPIFKEKPVFEKRIHVQKRDSKIINPLPVDKQNENKFFDYSEQRFLQIYYPV
ncbi:MAG: hypothetical protein AAFZ92_09400 [Pseudomonadota bacterium]